MTPDTFATQPLPPRDQLEAWREWFEPVLDVLPKHATGDEFTAETHMWKLGGLAMSRTIAPPVNVVRAKSNLRRDPVDHWVISYCARGAHFARTAGTETEVPAKVPFLWSLGQEFLHERTHVDRVQFFLARDAFRDIAPLLDGALGSTLDTPLGHLLGDYMMALERRLSVVTEADLSRLTTAVGAMIAAAVPHRPSGSPSPGGKSMWAARSGCGRRSVGTCGLRLWGPRTCVGWSECPDPIRIDCSKIVEVSLDTFSASDCSKRMRS